MSLQVTHNGAPALKRHLRVMERRVQDPSKVWPRIGSYLSKTFNKQFTTEGKHLGRPWKPLTPSYAKWKRRHGYSRKILVQTGDMKASLTRRPMDIEDYRGRSAVFGTSNQKAVWHHYGTRKGGQRVNPSRPIIVMTPGVRKDIKNIVQSYIVGRQKAARSVQESLF